MTNEELDLEMDLLEAQVLAHKARCTSPSYFHVEEDTLLALIAAARRPVPADVARDRETLGRIVRDAWVKWAETQPNPKPSWLIPWAELNETDKEADRQIGEAVAAAVLVPVGDVAEVVADMRSRTTTIKLGLCEYRTDPDEGCQRAVDLIESLSARLADAERREAQVRGEFASWKAERATLDAANKKRVYWNEPFWTDKEPYGDTLRSCTAEDAALIWMRQHPHVYYTDEEALEEFMVVNHAWWGKDHEREKEAAVKAETERCAGICDAEADARYHRARNPLPGDEVLPPFSQSMVQDCKAITARKLASAIRGGSNE